jgi:tRNA threonylcarbamoyladenosine biosynthesis protein TsaB
VSTGLVLGIETSGKSTGLALADSGSVVAVMVKDSDCGHNEVLMPLLDRLLAGAGVKAGDLSGIGVDIGPGMFTSLRVGVSAAKGLAIAHRIPVVGLNSLWSLARTALPTLDGVLSLVDARKHQVYAALYLGGRAVYPPAVMNPDELVSEVGRMPASQAGLIAGGNGAGICANLFAAAGIKIEPAGIDAPSPGVIAIEAGRRIACGKADDLASLEPLYLRRTDAELTREQRLNSRR